MKGLNLRGLRILVMPLVLLYMFYMCASNWNVTMGELDEHLLSQVALSNRD